MKQNLSFEPRIETTGQTETTAPSLCHPSYIHLVEFGQDVPKRWDSISEIERSRSGRNRFAENHAPTFACLPPQTIESMSSFTYAFFILGLVFAATTAPAQGRSLSQDEPAESPPASGGLVADLGCVRVNEVVHKPEDIDGVKGVDFVELFNDCEETVDMTGWSLADEKENRLTMGQDGCTHAIEGGSRIVFFRNNGCSIQFGFGGVDKVTLRDETDSVVDLVAWGKDDANKGYSWSRIPDGTGEFQDGTPTPGGANSV